jgi:hypothetical protein
MGMDALHEWLELTVGLAVARECNEINMAIDIKETLNRINNLKGSVERTIGDVGAKVAFVAELEHKVATLADKATAPAIRDLDTIASHLTEVATALEGNGGPPLENSSTPSVGVSPDRPPQP